MNQQKYTRGTSLFIILLILSLIYFMSTAFIFHTTDVPPATYYSASWFLQNSQAHKPKYPIFNLTPIENYTNISIEYLFEVLGDSRPFAWRLLVMNKYIPYVGWIPTFGSSQEYNISDIPYNDSFVVRTALLPTSTLNGSPLPTLWDPRSNIFYCEQFDVYETSLSYIKITPILFVPDNMLTTKIETYREGLAGIQYLVYKPNLDFLRLATQSADIASTRNQALTNPDLAKYLEIPEGYLDAYPQVQNFATSVALPDTSSVFLQVTYLISTLLSNFTINNDITFTDDPVAQFIDLRAGPPLAFVNTTALILRVLGIPTRVIWGFLGGNYNSETGTTRYSYYDFYPWIEVWDANIGWLPYPVFPIYREAQNLVSWLKTTINAPRKIYGYSAAYLNDTIDLRFELIGNFDSLANKTLLIYDLNESELISTSLFSKSQPNTFVATASFSYETFYANINKQPTFGRHIIIFSVGSLYGILELVLLRPTTIG